MWKLIRSSHDLSTHGLPPGCRLELQSDNGPDLIVYAADTRSRVFALLDWKVGFIVGDPDNTTLAVSGYLHTGANQYIALNLILAAVAPAEAKQCG